MKAPAPAVRLIGHPVVSGLLLLAGAPFAVFFALHGSQGLIPAVIIGAVLERIMRANATAMEYRAWKAAWDAMDDRPPRPKRGMLVARVAVAVLGGLYVAANIRDPHIQVALGFIGAALLLWIAVMLTRSQRTRPTRRPRSARTDLVSVSVRGPLLGVPTLQHAFRMLPEHCQRLRQATAS